MSLADHPQLVLLCYAAAIFAASLLIPKIINHLRLNSTTNYLRSCISVNGVGEMQIPPGFGLVCDRLATDIGGFSALQYCGETLLKQKKASVEAEYYRWAQRFQNGEGWVENEIRAHRCYILAIQYVINKGKSGKFAPKVTSDKVETVFRYLFPSSPEQIGEFQTNRLLKR